MTNGNADGGGGVGPGGQVTLPDGGTVPTVKCGDENVSSISGTWDVLGSRAGGEQSAAVVTLDKSSFSFAASGRSLTYAVSGATMTLVWRDEKEVPITVTHTDGALALGLFPLPVGGKWAFSSTSGGESCTSSLGPNGFDATCNVRSTPFGRLEGTVIGQRQQTLSSVFGDLGGVWHLAGKGNGSVVATIAGNTFTAVSTGSGGGPLGNSDSWVTVKVCNGTASGKTSDGFEFAATRQ